MTVDILLLFYQLKRWMLILLVSFSYLKRHFPCHRNGLISCEPIPARFVHVSILCFPLAQFELHYRFYISFDVADTYLAINSFELMIGYL